MTNRTSLSDASTSSGLNFELSFSIAAMADGSLVVADPDLDAVVRVDPVTGNRIIVSDAITRGDM